MRRKGTGAVVALAAVLAAALWFNRAPTSDLADPLRARTAPPRHDPPRHDPPRHDPPRSGPTLALPPAALLSEAPPAPSEAERAELENRLVRQIVIEADEAFEKADLEAASHLFQSIIDEHPDAQLAPYAAYKLAWCRFDEGDRPEAIRSLQLLVEWLETTDVQGGEALLDAAREDLEVFRSTDDAPVER